MEQSETGWIIVNENHPNTKSKFLITSSFASTRKRSIQLFVEGSGADWRYWYRKYNFRCKRATSNILLDDNK